MSSRETDEKEHLRLLRRLTAAAVHQEDGPSTVKLRIQAFVCGVDAIALSTRVVMVVYIRECIFDAGNEPKARISAHYS